MQIVLIHPFAQVPSLLFEAVQYPKTLPAIKYLVETCKLPLTGTNNLGYNVLHLAYERGPPEALHYLLSRNVIDVNAQTKRGLSLLGMACERGDSKLTQSLLDMKADPIVCLNVLTIVSSTTRVCVIASLRF